MRLINEVLDKELFDDDGHPMGRADGIVIRVDDGRPPRVTAIEVGPITLLRRFSHRLAPWYATLDRRFGPERGAPYRIAFSMLAFRAARIHVRLRAEDTPIIAVEKWLNARIVHRVPGSK
jgi:hypothetical protein